jgi:hypothetical protein
MKITPLLNAKSSAKSTFKQAQMEDGGATRAKVKAEAKANAHRGKILITLRLTTAATKGEREKENNINSDPVNPSLPAIAVIAA